MTLRQGQHTGQPIGLHARRDRLSLRLKSACAGAVLVVSLGAPVTTMAAPAQPQPAETTSAQATSSASEASTEATSSSLNDTTGALGNASLSRTKTLGALIMAGLLATLAAVVTYRVSGKDNKNR